MLRVAAIGKQIAINFIGEELDLELLTRVLLIHDMGNLVKIPNRELSDEAVVVKEKYISNYGQADHKISEIIAKELGYSDLEIELLNSKVFIQNESTYYSNNYLLKIAAYSDQRVSPIGIMPILDRLNEAKQRYRDKPNTSMNNSNTDKLIEYALKIEEQIFKYCNIRPEDINNECAKKYITELEKFNV